MMKRRAQAANVRLDGKRQHDVERLADLDAEEPGRHHADDRAGDSVDRHRLPNHVGGTGESPLPDPIAMTVTRPSGPPPFTSSTVVKVRPSSADTPSVPEEAAAGEKGIRRLRLAALRQIDTGRGPREPAVEQRGPLVACESHIRSSCRRRP